jgi:glycosyltransferase involved in cell wall biosynthesis
MSCGAAVAARTDAPLRILLTNRVLAHRTGTELYVRDVAAGLLTRGHRPIVYSPRLGALASEIRAATIPVVDDLAGIAEPPDVIHGHHGLETLTALLAFPRAPAISVCHSWVGWADEPVRLDRVRRYLAVDDTCRDRLVSEHRIPPECVDVILNAVDLRRFRSRPPLPERPVRALVFSNSSAPDAPHVQAIRGACTLAGVAVDVAGFKAGRSLSRPEDTIGAYDIVFAKARAALEAAAVGTAVVLCDVAGAGPMVTTGNFEALRRVNFGMRALRNVPTVDVIAREIARYDAGDAEAVSVRVRTVASDDALVDQLLAIYREVLEEFSPEDCNPDAERRAAAAYLQRLSPMLHERDLLQTAFRRLLRVPLAGRWIGRRARAEPPGHWLQELLRAVTRE